jgi:hypothetical protein
MGMRCALVAVCQRARASWGEASEQADSGRPGTWACRLTIAVAYSQAAALEIDRCS